ncbi:hypothetical protein IJ21_31990 [Paenibacillus sp. 32O-W]|jgi:hypothetical protein|nr:hypothetical protein IJ21_31990 [Paenibacillus sp. 32O-W]
MSGFAGFGFGRHFGLVLVLFILLVIILSTVII